MRTFTLVILIFSMGCSHLLLSRSEEPRPTGDTHVFELDYFFWGFLPATKLKSESEICPKSRIESIEMAMATGDVLKSLVTFGIYVPHRVAVTCGKELAAAH